MSGTTGTIPLQPWVDDQLITKEVLNAENANIGSLMDAAGCGGHSDTDADAQLQTAPYPGSVLSKATSIAGELERLRYQIAQILGTDYWYKPAPVDISTVGKGSFIGAIVDAPSATPPNANWHLADGTAISRAAYPDLFAYIGTTFGVGDNSTTFNLPDYRDRISIGAGTTYLVAQTGGALTGTAEHSHTVNSHAHDLNNHIHRMDFGQQSGQANPSSGTLICTNDTDGAFMFAKSGIGSTTIREMKNQTLGATVNSGTAAPGTDTQAPTVEVLNPYLAMYKMIRVL